MFVFVYHKICTYNNPPEKSSLYLERMEMLYIALGSEEHPRHIRVVEGGMDLRAYFGGSSKWH